MLDPEPDPDVDEAGLKKADESETPVPMKRKEPRTAWKLLTLYVQEVFEAMIAILVVRVAMEKEIHVRKMFVASCVIGLLTFVLEQYSPDFKSSVSQGISFSVGSQIISKFV
jgi:hypothetical protein